MAEVGEGLGLPYGLKPVNPVLVDTWAGPYSSVAVANSEIPLSVRKQTKFVHIIDAADGNKGKIYWYKDGIADNNLVYFEQFETVLNLNKIGVSFVFQFKPYVENEFPISGQLTFNNVDQSAITEIKINYDEYNNGGYIKPFIEMLTKDAKIKLQAYSNNSDSAIKNKYIIFNVTGKPTDDAVNSCLNIPVIVLNKGTDIVNLSIIGLILFGGGGASIEGNNGNIPIINNNTLTDSNVNLNKLYKMVKASLA